MSVTEYRVHLRQVDHLSDLVRDVGVAVHALTYADRPEVAERLMLAAEAALRAQSRRIQIQRLRSVCEVWGIDRRSQRMATEVAWRLLKEEQR